MEEHRSSSMALNLYPDFGDRFPQWSLQETQEFLAIRAQLDRSFMERKRNKILWDVASQQMMEKGYNRTADQCKCKWKNLVNRYKGSEGMESEVARQVPFYDELRAIFTARMQRLLWLESVGASSSANKKQKLDLSDEFSDGEEGEESDDDKVQQQQQHQQQQQQQQQQLQHQQQQQLKKKRKEKPRITTEKGRSGDNMQEVIEEFLRQQQQMELQWLEALETREKERRTRELEWRQAMEALEKERMVMENRWREKEEQRKTREEARSEKRDALLTALLTRLIGNDT